MPNKSAERLLGLVFSPTPAEVPDSLRYDDTMAAAALLAALSQTVFSGSEPSLSELKQLVKTVALALIDARKLGDAHRVLTACPPAIRNSMPIRSVLARLYFRLALTDRLEAEITSLLATPPASPKLHRMHSLQVSRVGLGWRLGHLCKVKPAFHGRLPDDPEEWLRRGDGEFIGADSSPLLGDDVLAPYMAVSGKSAEEIRARQARLRPFLTRNRMMFVADAVARQMPPDTPGAAELIALCDRYLNEHVQVDLAPLIAAQKAGRNPILLMAHDGPTMRYGQLLRFPGKFAVFASIPIFRPNGLWINSSKDQATVSASILQMARAIRKEPHLVAVLPDQALSGKRTEVTLAGRGFSFGLGAAVVARMAPSTLFFVNTTRRGHDVVMTVTQGPDLGPNLQIEAAERAFAEFYAQGLMRALQTPLHRLGSFDFLKNTWHSRGAEEF